MSHPSWVRGLKWRHFRRRRLPAYVAPFMGAWIEMMTDAIAAAIYEVAPFMGAWIEIGQTAHTRQGTSKSHPSWVRGLKSALIRCGVLGMTRRTLHGCVD